MKVRAFWDDLTLGDVHFARGQVVETKPTKTVLGAIKGGLLQVVEQDRKPLFANANEPSPSPSSPHIPPIEKSSPQR